MAFFIVPFILGEVVGILSAIAAAKFYFIGAFMLYILKIPLVVIALAILNNGKEKLLSYGWFLICYSWVTKILNQLHNSELYLKVTLNIRLIKSSIISRLKKIKKYIFRYKYRK